MKSLKKWLKDRRSSHENLWFFEVFERIVTSDSLNFYFFSKEMEPNELKPMVP
jgi:hypothetical protein